MKASMLMAIAISGAKKREQIIERALELQLEKIRTTRILTGHIPQKEKGNSTLELQDVRSEESLESNRDSEFDAFTEELDSNWCDLIAHNSIVF